MTTARIMESINTAKNIIVDIIESDSIMYTQENEGLTELGEIIYKTYNYTFSDLLYVYPRKAVVMLRNLLFNTKNTLPIRIRIALAALLETSVFDNTTRYTSVYFGVADWYSGDQNKVVDMYKWFSKNWGHFDVNISLKVNPEYASDEESTLNLMTGEWKEA